MALPIFINFRFSQLDLITNCLKCSIWILDKSIEVTLQKPIGWFNFIAFFAGPDPPERRKLAFGAYFKDKLYYLGGKSPKTEEPTNRVDVRRSNEVHEIINSGFNRWKMANRTCSSSSNYCCSNNNMRWNFLRSYYSIFIIVIMDIQLLMHLVVIRYIDYQTMNGNGLKLERFQKYDIISELHR